MRSITGIGSRETPPDVLGHMEAVGAWRVRSGGAEGADYAFERGAMDFTDVFLPWGNFNKHLPRLGLPIVVDPSDALDALVTTYHPASRNLSHGGWSLMRRNGPQVLGLDLKTPSDAVVCWRQRRGGTDQALRIAQGHGIPVFNMHDPQYGTAELVKEALLGLWEKHEQRET